MNSKTIFDYLPAEVADRLKEYEASTNRTMDMSREENPIKYLYIESYGKTNKDIERLECERKKINNHMSPRDLFFKRFTYETYSDIAHIVHMACFVPEGKEKTLSELFKESRNNHDKKKLKEIQDIINHDSKLKRLVMNMLFIIYMESLKEKNEQEIQESKTADFTGRGNFATLSAMTYVFQRLDNINFIEDYTEIINSYMNDYKLVISSGSWDIVEIQRRGKRGSYSTEKKRYQKRNDLGISVISIPDKLLNITEKERKNALDLYTAHSGIGLIPRELLNDNNEITRDVLEQLKRREWTSSINDENMDINIVHIIFSSIFEKLKPLYETEAKPELEDIPLEFKMDIKSIAESLYQSVRADKYDKTLERLENVYKHTSGIVIYEKDKKALPALENLKYDKESMTVSFEAPLLSFYAREILEGRQKSAIARLEKRKEKEEKRAKRQDRETVDVKFRKEDFNAVVSYMEKPSLNKRGDKAAVAIVRYILKWVPSAGLFREEGRNQNTSYWTLKKNKHVSINLSTLRERISILDDRLSKSKNLTQTLERIFTHVWEYLKEDTTFSETYPFLKFPGSGADIPIVETLKKTEKAKYHEWVPQGKLTDGNKIDFKLEFEIMSQSEQLKNKK